MGKTENLVERAKKVINFRSQIIKAFKKLSNDLNIPIPTDEQIGKYVEEYGFNVKGFIFDYTNRQGMFKCIKTPLEVFIDKVNRVRLNDNPKVEEIRSFFEKHGDNLDLFLEERHLKKMEPLVKETYLNVSKLPHDKLVTLWNIFIEESSLYGDDSHIFDLSKGDEQTYIFSQTSVKEDNIIREKRARYVQWFYSNGKYSLHVIEENQIRYLIHPYWEEIFERIMLYPSAYNFKVEIYCAGDESTFFDDVFFPIIAKKIGYLVEGDKGTIKKIQPTCRDWSDNDEYNMNIILHNLDMCRNILIKRNKTDSAARFKMLYDWLKNLHSDLVG